ncbi:MAG: hypothetical protein AAGA77_16125 [Bacteroidota bacterium]
MIRQIRLFVLLILFPFFLTAQSEYPLQSSVGMHLTYDEDTGWGVSARYLHKLKNAGLLKFELKTDFRFYHVGRFGYEFLNTKNDRFEFGIGLDLRFRIEQLERFGVSRRTEFAIELPVEARYHLSDDYFISSGISFSRRLSSTSLSNLQGFSIPEIRLGLGYKF